MADELDEIVDKELEDLDLSGIDLKEVDLKEDVEAKVEEKLNALKALNLAESISLSNGKTYKMRDLDVLSQIVLSGKVAEYLQEFQDKLVDLADDENVRLELEILKLFGTKKNFRKDLSEVIALLLREEDSTQFEYLQPEDLSKLLAAVEEVVDIEKFKETFFQEAQVWFRIFQQ